jgi:hypothetical protein
MERRKKNFLDPRNNLKEHNFWPQRVWNDLLRTRLSCGYMLRLLAQPPFPPLPSASCLSSQSSCVSPVELTDERGGRGVGEETNHSTAGKPGVALYKSFNTLCLTIFVRYLSVSAIDVRDMLCIPLWSLSTCQTHKYVLYTYCSASMRTLNPWRRVRKTAYGSPSGDKKSTWHSHST